MNVAHLSTMLMFITMNMSSMFVEEMELCSHQDRCSAHIQEQHPAH